ncbi:hypothetical protein VTI74DRAFT_5456 [Chaetomium olivicolor]
MTRLWTVLHALALPAAATDTFDCTKTCETLASALPNLVSFPNSPSYIQHNAYWSARQSEVHPACFVAPRSTRDVSKAIAILIGANAPFTVKAGGHTAFENGSSTRGITVTLSSLTGITVSPDRRTVSVGAGNRWINVSSALDPLNLAVVAGRSSTVGVSGLTLGGGISYFSGRYGWACDNVRSFEVVLASGRVVNASPRENRDLYWALRGGGGSNFGVVTRFDLAAFDQGELWASSLVWPGSANRTLIPLMHELLVKGLPADPAAHSYFVMGWVEQVGGYVALTDQFHSKHGDVAAVPEVFEKWHGDGAPPTLMKNTRMANVSQLSRDIEQPSGMRQTWWATSVRATATPQVLLDIVPLWEGYVARLLNAAAETGSKVTPYLIYQSISTNILEAMQVNGGNALGLKPEDGPVMIVQLTATWDKAELDEAVEGSTKDLIGEIDALASSRGARSKNGFIYMNYAGKTQDVYVGYGKENQERLRKVASKYDPKGKFRGLWRGYFKV